DIQRLAVLRDRETGRRPLVLPGTLADLRVALGQELLAVGILEDDLVREQPVGVVEPVDQVVEPAAGEDLLAVGRPGQPGEGPGGGDAGGGRDVPPHPPPRPGARGSGGGGSPGWVGGGGERSGGGSLRALPGAPPV